MAACYDGLDHEDVQKLSHLGSDGMYSGHVARDLRGHLQPNMLEGSIARLSLRIPHGSHQINALYTSVMPHKLFAAMWEKDHKVFAEYWGEHDAEQLKKFWMGLPPEKRPAENALTTTVPIRLFGDGVQVLGINKSWGKSAQAFLLAPLISTASSRNSQILLNLLWKKKVTRESELKWWRTLSWSFSALLEGKWPVLDASGDAIDRDTDAGRRSNSWLAGGMKER